MIVCSYDHTIILSYDRMIAILEEIHASAKRFFEPFAAEVPSEQGEPEPEPVPPQPVRITGLLWGQAAIGLDGSETCPSP